MPRATQPTTPLALICGEDDFAVAQHARELYQKWSQELGGMDHETIDAGAGNSGDALRSLARLREALQTLPFFGSGKAVWFKGCNFLGDERAAETQAVTESLGELAQELKSFKWDNVRLLISAGKVDKRKVFYKTVEKLGTVENFAGLSAEDRDWMAQAELLARQALRERKKEISDEALAELVSSVGPHARQLHSEAEKLALYVGSRMEIEVADVLAVCTRNKSARAFALGDALGDRDLPRLLRALDEELWEMQFDKQKSAIGLLYGLIGKVRAMILLKEMLSAGWIKPDAEYSRFKTQLERVPAEELPADKRFNPRSLNPYVLFKALPQARRYSQQELIQAMDLLLQCNRKLVSSGQAPALLLQQTLVQIAGQPAAAPKAAAKARPRP